MHAEVPRVKQNDGRVVTHQVSWGRKGSGFTLLFEAYSMLMIENEMPVKNIGELINEYPQRIWNIFDAWVSNPHKEDVVEALLKSNLMKLLTRRGIIMLQHLLTFNPEEFYMFLKGKVQRILNNQLSI